MKPEGFPSLRLRRGSPIHAKNLKIISELVPVRGFDRWFCLWLKVVTSGNFLVLFFFFFFDRAVLVLVMMWPDLWVQVSNGGFDKTDATWGLITTSTRIITTWLRLLKCADVMILCLIQRKICPNSTMLRQSLQQQRRAKACPPRLSLPHSHCTQALTPLLLLLCPSWQRAYVGAQGVFSGTNGAWGTKKKKKGCGWRLERSPRCQSRSCASSADKEGESVLIWAAVQSNSDWGARECRHTSD